VKNAFKSEKPGYSRRLAESTYTKAVTTNSSFYIYYFGSERSRSSSAHWIEGPLDSQMVVRAATNPLSRYNEPSTKACSLHSWTSMTGSSSRNTGSGAQVSLQHFSITREPGRARCSVSNSCGWSHVRLRCSVENAGAVEWFALWNVRIRVDSSY
jgi:hypothetical protein